MTIVLRRPLPEEAKACADLHVKCWREAYRGMVPDALLDGADGSRDEVWWQAIGYPSSIVIAAFEGPVPVGFVMLDLARAAFVDGHIGALYVLARHHRQGIGRKLLGAAAGQWQAKDGTGLTVEVLTDNHSARRFYEAMGARLVKTGTHDWSGHSLPIATYLFEDLGKLVAMAANISAT